MNKYVSSKGEEKDPSTMDHKYLVNALIVNIKKVANSGENASSEEINNVAVLTEEVTKRLSNLK